MDHLKDKCELQSTSQYVTSVKQDIKDNLFDRSINTENTKCCCQQFNVKDVQGLVIRKWIFDNQEALSSINTHNDPLGILKRGKNECSKTMQYATRVYLRSQNSQGDFRVSLLCSKTKNAPIKSHSIPRLELCASNS
ncbi:hypothetical protein ILUMI_04416 [Ignelater luminosus]|uniref:Uncharacterized protein n=1 Tax=Ignelater luminosus TaxID=2038154 RepID=A0A8K0DDX7_IGNLU|nr:hypothetical protein ILUMI_04416 [Ignelater luminosus]